MSKIEENAFLIARYLLENLEEIGQVEVREALALAEDDYIVALKFLVDAGCLRVSGTALIGGKNLARLQDFVNRVGKERIPLSHNAERLLKLLFDNQSDFPFSVGDHIISEFKWSENQYIQVARELSDKGFVRGEYASGNPFFKISILSNGREAIRNNFRLEKSSQGLVQIEKVIAINDNKGIVNIGSILESVYQSIEVNSRIDSSSKQELERLLQQLESALKEVPKENEDDVEAITEMAKGLVENATKEKPNKPLVEISADGLKKAAMNLAAVTPLVLVIAEKLIAFVFALHR